MNQLETLAAPLALATWTQELQGRDVIHFVDNDGAASSLVKGFSPKADTAHLAGEYWTLAAAHRINIYIDRIESKSNLADGPSRHELNYGAFLGAKLSPAEPSFLFSVSPFSFPSKCYVRSA